MRLVDLYWPVAQMVERLTVNQMVAGSSPAGSAILRGVAVVAYQPHKLVVAGSSPAPATMPVPRTERRRFLSKTGAIRQAKYEPAPWLTV